MPLAFSFAGVYLPGAALLLIALIPFFIVIDRMLVVMGWYRWLWHPSLFRMALMISLYALAIIQLVG
ncbi:MAG: DUF1656 domain-containing protein [Pseudomonadota bacterium]|uniref:DUF1656 domain-containing protein n=1 Tax=Alteromonas alba TaxID=2079529 RepID=A0A2S9VA44_9ALTE|nr:DUF1656 domain-containing protein [Alteromonas alba]MAJ70302.1 DUF1656 domain-containing protein [Alteromonadaceae bacterium]MCP4864785.1 DUF1656 domain-containing protein [Alteromonas sp.]MDY6928564.1 DUF1656 domain-containing protein [Pseudomonadota bacterium]RPH12844.1 MAG: DUF1656 domain-containing protein [Alteromonadaceae bacterium TMED7]PRO73318.1 DUF1656 domain-containing protein [Alteromonas alba]|tara:strand:+ start:817 stop:1017 length:201 start_codon:yes stop_codon:yes gene_type:complete